MRSSHRCAFFSFGVSFVLSALALAPAWSQSSRLRADWTVPVKALADKIVAVASSSTPGPLEVSLANSSSLSPTDASAIYDGVVAGLASQHFEISDSQMPSAANAKVLITLSENSEEYVWSAEIWLPGASDAERHVAIVEAPKDSAAAPHADHASVTLTRKPIWSQPGKVLDFDLLTSPGGPDGLVVLEPERVVFYRADTGGWSFDHDSAISHAFSWQRDVSGKIDVMNGKLTISDAECEGDLLHLGALTCKQTPRQVPTSQNPNAIGAKLGADTADFVQLGTFCADIGPLFLTSGDGDWTHADSLAAHVGSSGNASMTEGMATAVGQPIQVPGPVLEMGATSDGKAAKIVSRNLQTGMYEASIVSVSCTN